MFFIVFNAYSIYTNQAKMTVTSARPDLTLPMSTLVSLTSIDTNPTISSNASSSSTSTAAAPIDESDQFRSEIHKVISCYRRKLKRLCLSAQLPPFETPCVGVTTHRIQDSNDRIRHLRQSIHKDIHQTIPDQQTIIDSPPFLIDQPQPPCIAQLRDEGIKIAQAYIVEARERINTEQWAIRAHQLFILQAETVASSIRPYLHSLSVFNTFPSGILPVVADYLHPEHSGSALPIAETKVAKIASLSSALPA
jgi:hypothetical protein